jgi:hypothetical protein
MPCADRVQALVLTESGDVRNCNGNSPAFRNAGFGRFTADRLIAVLNRPGLRVEVKIRPAKSSS